MDNRVFNRFTTSSAKSLSSLFYTTCISTFTFILSLLGSSLIVLAILYILGIIIGVVLTFILFLILLGGSIITILGGLSIFYISIPVN